MPKSTPVPLQAALAYWAAELLRTLARRGNQFADILLEQGLVDACAHVLGQVSMGAALQDHAPAMPSGGEAAASAAAPLSAVVPLSCIVLLLMKDLLSQCGPLQQQAAQSVSAACQLLLAPPAAPGACGLLGMKDLQQYVQDAMAAAILKLASSHNVGDVCGSMVQALLSALGCPGSRDEPTMTEVDHLLTQPAANPAPAADTYAAAEAVASMMAAISKSHKGQVDTIAQPLAEALLQRLSTLTVPVASHEPVAYCCARAISACSPQVCLLLVAQLVAAGGKAAQETRTSSSSTGAKQINVAGLVAARVLHALIDEASSSVPGCSQPLDAWLASQPGSTTASPAEAAAASLQAEPALPSVEQCSQEAVCVALARLAGSGALAACWQPGTPDYTLTASKQQGYATDETIGCISSTSAMLYVVLVQLADSSVRSAMEALWPGRQEAHARECEALTLGCVSQVVALMGDVGHCESDWVLLARHAACSALGEAQVGVEGQGPASSTAASPAPPPPSTSVITGLEGAPGASPAPARPTWHGADQLLDSSCDSMAQALTGLVTHVSSEEQAWALDTFIRRFVRNLDTRGELCKVTSQANTARLFAQGTLQASLAKAQADGFPSSWGLMKAVADIPHARERLRDTGVIPAAITRLSQHLGNFDCLVLLKFLSLSDSLHTSLKDCGAVEVVERVLREGQPDEQTKYQAVSVLANLCSGTGEGSDARAAQLLDEFDVTPLLCTKLAGASKDGQHKDEKGTSMLNTVAQTAAAFARTPKNAQRLMSLGAHTSLLTALGNEHGRVADTLPHLVRALMYLSDVPGLVAQLQEAGAVAVLQALLPGQPGAPSLDARTDDNLRACLLRLGGLDDAKAEAALKTSALGIAAAGGASANNGSAAGSGSSTGGYTWDVFLSHKRTDAKDFARALYTLLTLRGLTAFLDYEWREELSQLGSAVAASRNLVFILTDNVLDSDWCIKELQAAVKAGTNIILVTKEGARWKDEEDKPTCLFPPAHLVAKLPADVQPIFTRKSVQHSDEYYGAFVTQLMAKVVLEQPGQGGQAVAGAGDTTAVVATAAAPAAGGQASLPAAYTMQLGAHVQQPGWQQQGSPPGQYPPGTHMQAGPYPGRRGPVATQAPAPSSQAHEALASDMRSLREEVRGLRELAQQQATELRLMREQGASESRALREEVARLAQTLAIRATVEQEVRSHLAVLAPLQPAAATTAQQPREDAAAALQQRVTSQLQLVSGDVSDVKRGLASLAGSMASLQQAVVAVQAGAGAALQPAAVPGVAAEAVGGGSSSSWPQPGMTAPLMQPQQHMMVIQQQPGYATDSALYARQQQGSGVGGGMRLGGSRFESQPLAAPGSLPPIRGRGAGAGAGGRRYGGGFMPHGQQGPHR